MEMGTWADWVSAIGGLLAVIAAVISWKVSDRALQVQQDQNEREKEEQRLDMVRRRREQASLVVAFGANCLSVAMTRYGACSSTTVRSVRCSTSLSKASI